MLHDDALRVVDVLKLFGSYLLFVLDLFCLRFLREVQLEVLKVGFIQVGLISLQHVEFSTERASVFSLSLQLHQTSHTKDMVTR
jgi:hypothetical protein